MAGKDVTLYGLKTCDTCRKARRALEAAGYSVRFVDLRDEPVDDARRAAWRAAFDDALVNRRSTTWRGLSEGERARDPDALLADYPALMKRPVIEADGALYLGWSPEGAAALLDA